MTETGSITARFRIEKVSPDEHTVFGWAYVPIDRDGNQVEDWSGDRVDIKTIEKAAYKYVMLYRDGSEMHERGGIGTIIESMVFTEDKLKMLGIPKGTVPLGWWIGMYIEDESVWEKVKNGKYRMFSIEGTANRTPIEE